MSRSTNQKHDQKSSRKPWCPFQTDSISFLHEIGIHFRDNPIFLLIFPWCFPSFPRKKPNFEKSAAFSKPRSSTWNASRLESQNTTVNSSHRSLHSRDTSSEHPNSIFQTGFFEMSKSGGRLKLFYSGSLIQLHYVSSSKENLPFFSVFFTGLFISKFYASNTRWS